MDKLSVNKKGNAKKNNDILGRGGLGGYPVHRPSPSTPLTV